jgi:isocitrate lyase
LAAQVEQLFMAQMHHDRKQRHERLSWTASQRADKPAAVDFLMPIIAGVTQ